MKVSDKDIPLLQGLRWLSWPRLSWFFSVLLSKSWDSTSGRYCFLPNPSKFITHMSSYHPVLCNIDPDSVTKSNDRKKNPPILCVSKGHCFMRVNVNRCEPDRSPLSSAKVNPLATKPLHETTGMMAMAVVTMMLLLWYCYCYCYVYDCCDCYHYPPPLYIILTLLTSLLNGSLRFTINMFQWLHAITCSICLIKKLLHFLSDHCVVFVSPCQLQNQVMDFTLYVINIYSILGYPNTVLSNFLHEIKMTWLMHKVVRLLR
jgi:hypothetical protein